MQGWIKLHRKILQKGYYLDSEYVHLWLHLLLRASHEEKEFLWNGKLIKLGPGQFVTGRNKLSEETGISSSKVERILNCFKSEQQIEQQSTNKFRLITVLNWKEYQSIEQQNEPPVNSKRTATGQPVNTIKNLRIKELKNNTESRSAPPPLEEQLKPFREKYPKETIEAFINYWTEKNPNGKKERWQMQKVFDVSRRLITWSSKEWNKKPAGQNKNEMILHDGTKAIKNFGSWVDANNPTVKIDPHYYPEIAKD